MVSSSRDGAVWWGEEGLGVLCESYGSC
jgi:hypothetical protein